MNIANWNAGLTQAEARSQRFSSRINGVTRGVSSRFSALRGTVVSALAVLGGAQALTAIDTQLKLSQATGLTFERFQQLAGVFELAAVSNEQFTRGLTTLSDRLVQLERGSATLSDAFGRLGLATGDFTSSQEQNLLTVLDALRAVTDESERAAIATQIFGSRLAIGLGPVLASTNADLVALAGTIATVSEPDAEGIARFNDSLTSLGRATTRLVSQFAPFLQRVASIFEAVTRAADAINGLGSAIATGLVLIIANRFLPVFAALRGALALNARDLYRNTVVALGYGRVIGGVSFANRRFLISIRNQVGALAGVRAGFLAARLSALGLRAAITLLTGGLNLVVTAIAAGVITVLTDLENGWRRVANTALGFFNILRQGSNYFFGTSFALSELYEISTQLETGLDGVTDSAVDLATAFQTLPETIEEVATELMEAPENAETAWQTFLNGTTDVLSQYETLAMDTFNNLGDAIAGFFETGRLSLSDFVADFIRQFARIQINNALGLLFGGAGGFTATARQFGGPVNAGQPYIVGERGPELFIPNGGGVVERNSELGGGGGGTNIVINAVDTQSFEAALARDPAYISNLVQAGNRQLGIR